MVDVQELHETIQALDAATPTGTWAGAPALGASNAVLTNTTEYDVEVGVSGGTVTVIKKNGVTLTATTAGRFVLRPGSTISITWSVAPTLQWIYR